MKIWVVFFCLSLALCRHIGRVIPALAVSQETEILRDQEKVASQPIQIGEIACKQHGSSWAFELRIKPEDPQPPPKKVSSMFSTNSQSCWHFTDPPVGTTDDENWMCTVTKWSFFFWQISRGPKRKFADCLLFSVAKSRASHAASHREHKFTWKTNKIEVGKIGS